jgi:HEAT repeat protein
MSRPSRTWLRFVALASAGVLCCAVSTAWSQIVNDPVEQLRLALKEDRNLPALPDPGDEIRFKKVKQDIDNKLAFRRENLNKKASQLKSIAELRRALMLADWREETSSSDDPIFLIDVEIRRQIGERFKEAIRRDIERGTAKQRMVAVRAIADIPPTFRAPVGDKFASFTRDFTDDVVKLSESSDKRIAQQALITLGVINALPSAAADRFSSVLLDKRPDRDELRKDAAQGLKRMMQVANSMPKTHPFKAVNTREDLFITAREVVRVCLLVLQDPSFEWPVRTACLEAIEESARGLESLAEAFTENKNVPPEGRPLSDIEVDGLVKQYETLRDEFNERAPYFKLLGNAAPYVASALGDSSAPVRLAAIDALSTIANARLIRANRLAILPLDRRTEEELRKKNGLIVIEDPFAVLLQKWFGQIMTLRADPNLIIRQRFFEFLEKLEMDAVPALPALVEALDYPDPRSTVPLIAARTIKSMVLLENMRRLAPRNKNRVPPPPPKLSDEQMKTAVPGLAKLLAHPEVEFKLYRQEAAGALEAMGPLAGLARRQIGQASRTGDVNSRLLVFPIIPRLSAEDAKAVVPDLMKNLEPRLDARLKKGAAETLGKIGPPASEALGALFRLALGDEDEEVRVAAQDAYLSISPPPE